MTKLTSVIRRQTAKRTDKRIKLMAEIINGIQVNFLNVYRNTLRFENAKVFFFLLFIGGKLNLNYIPSLAENNKVTQR